MNNITLSASLMCGDLLNLAKDIEVLAANNIDYIHLDVMDGHFVPNITFGLDLVNAITHPKDIHLMVKDAEWIITRLNIGEGDIVIFHIESNADAKKTIDLIKKSVQKLV